MSWSQSVAVMVCAVVVILVVNWVAMAMQVPDVARIAALIIVGAIALVIVVRAGGSRPSQR